MQITTTICREINGIETEFDVEVGFSFYKGRAGTLEEPPEYDEVEIWEVKDDNGRDWLDDLSTYELESIEEQCFEAINDRMDDL